MASFRCRTGTGRVNQLELDSVGVGGASPTSKNYVASLAPERMCCKAVRTAPRRADTVAITRINGQASTAEVSRVLNMEEAADANYVDAGWFE